MSQGRNRRSRSLTGVWEGIYSYPVSWMPAVLFTATLIEAGRSLSGSVHEQCSTSGATLLFSVSGSRRSTTVGFVKTYLGTSNRYGTIIYEGTINDDATEIEGRWIIPRDWSGRFLMIRSGGQPQVAAESEGAEACLETIETTPVS